ncbi:5-methyltetrahydropteroyltriglutamate--homocysteine S-methyltransferase [Chitinophaga pendula]|uniref:5-methyltetrahydropteroyltriglutamate-- homocysteine S-methyltransferase n=1 Tax=Chitinophaga pendula TaxID=2849666 RepID=UPI001CED3408|nr:5-methyltetrahydropteroyltriglutamate--homocysteine S-methyltransferase [Chitinophaga pendula]UCJ08074.1 5-methyltetrahydropteroyltriglutamate--homocysteine S-methyltransferase [Chitinophaga pendula]
MLTNVPGYPRIGSGRELKKANEAYWAGTASLEKLQLTARQLRRQNWEAMQQAGIDLIPSNDFSYYDQVLDMCLMTGTIPARFKPLLERLASPQSLELYFAMARGYQKNGLDITAMEMTKWFDTNYHYLVPEFDTTQQYRLLSHKCVEEFREAKSLGIHTKPVIIGPLTFLLLGKIKDHSLHLHSLLEQLLPVYLQLLTALQEAGATWIQIDEPYLAMDLNPAIHQLYINTYNRIHQAIPGLQLLIATYFDALGDNLATALQLPVQALHIDLVRAPQQLTTVLQQLPAGMQLSLGVVDGRNIWKNDYQLSLALINEAVQAIGQDRVWISSACSLLHTPYDLDLEQDEQVLTREIKHWMAFAKQKLHEIADLAQIATGNNTSLAANMAAMQAKQHSPLIHKPAVKARVAALDESHATRKSPFHVRQESQEVAFQLPLFPTTTIGSFPQTAEIRQLRAQLKKGTISSEEYHQRIKAAIAETVKWQESLHLDVLVHGEFERNDMVEYFGEQLEGFVFTQNGWVQSYGSRCVKPPIIYGDVQRTHPMTVAWSSYAQSLTKKPMKGMLTGPVTILQWSFVRNDQPRADTTFQIALAIRDEVSDLEKAGIRVIQVDEPAVREGLPLRRANWDAYLQWAVQAFRIAVCSVLDDTQIHTHMCYAEFNDIIDSIAAMDADVITIETSRSQMELLEAFARFKYPNEIGPGVYDIHSPRVPTVEEMSSLLQKASTLLPARNIWVNPDCGLKTRNWPETEQSLRNMVAAAVQSRSAVLVN